MSRFQPRLKSIGLVRVWHGILANGEELICAEPNPNSVTPKSMKLRGIDPGSPDRQHDIIRARYRVIGRILASYHSNWAAHILPIQ